MARLFRTRLHAVAWVGTLVSLVGVVLLTARRLETSGLIAGASSTDFAFVAGTRDGQLVTGSVVALAGGIVAVVGAARLARTWTLRALLAGIVVLVAGVVLLVVAPHPSVQYFAYAPLSDTAFLPSLHPWLEHLGQVLVLLGAVVAAFTAGRLSAQRHH